MKSRAWDRFFLLFVLYILAGTISAQENTDPTGGNLLDLRTTDTASRMTFYDAPTGASTTGQPVAVGDINGNGCGDIVVAGQNSSFGALEGWRNNAGHLRIIMDVCVIGGIVDMNSPLPEGQAVVTVRGARSEDMLGTEIFVGDFNADGFDDILVGAQNHGGVNNQRSRAGAAYLIFGQDSFAGYGRIDINARSDILVIDGADAEDRLGIWVDGGDFDGDGFLDLLIGANQADGIENRNVNAGETWIIYGSSDILGQYGNTIDLRQPPQTATRIIGADIDDLMGSTLLGADVDNDGVDDVIVSAALWRGSAGLGGLDFGGGDGPGNLRYNAGDTFIIFGRDTLRGQTIELSNQIDVNGQPTSDTISVIYGVDANDLLGEELAAGDIDGDGLTDLAIGTLVSDGLDNQMPEAGEAWVIFGTELARGQMIDLANTIPDNAVVIYPDQPSSKGGDILRIADIDNDSFDDLLYGAPNYDPIGFNQLTRRNAGMLVILFGASQGFGSDERILLPSEDIRTKYVIGADSEDMMAYGLAVYDLDGDGILDVIPNGMGGDGQNNGLTNSGEIYAINGLLFQAESAP
ncbi:MAG: integrin alpha [Anaerolineae bacterium]|nr:integrin alpha [Anaerolineae bacterium]MDQ7037506.1 integrin alpha [Anaerolineae bacterium]